MKSKQGSRHSKNTGLGKSRFVVIPGAVSRPVKGVKALDALRNQLKST